MATNKYYKKFIRIPPSESIDIREIMPIIHHPLFQRLLHIFQLGANLVVFPGASHNRFEHALGVYGKTSLFCERLVKDGFLTPYQAKNISLFGLLHDIGHGPFSHVIEELTPFNHDENGFRIISQLSKEIKKAGGDPKFIKALFGRKNSFYKIVMDKNLGMDKLDYLERDVYHTGFGQKPDIKSVFDYLSFMNGNLVIDKKSLEAAKQMQRLYNYMYKEFYLHKSSQISQRFMEKMIATWISLDKVDSGKLWLMSDYELLAHIYRHKDSALQFLYQCYKNRNFPKTGLVIRLKNRQLKERISGKKIRVIGESKEFFEKFGKVSSFRELEKIEKLIGQALGIEDFKILIVPMITPWRFVPEDILYHDNGKILSLKKIYPEYFNSMKSESDDYVAVRVCIIGDRELLYRNSKKVLQVIKNYLRTK
ncbi:MAG: HD domain-containing protein [Candidatus Paceibacterota bacterium]